MSLGGLLSDFLCALDIGDGQYKGGAARAFEYGAVSVFHVNIAVGELASELPKRAGAVGEMDEQNIFFRIFQPQSIKRFFGWTEAVDDQPHRRHARLFGGHQTQNVDGLFRELRAELGQPPALVFHHYRKLLRHCHGCSLLSTMLTNAKLSS